jgi:hypothetical protein
MGWTAAVRFPGGARCLFCPQHPYRYLGPAQPPSERVSGTLSPGVKRTMIGADYSLPSSVDVKNGATIPRLPHTPSWHSTKLIHYKDNFTLPTCITFRLNFVHVIVIFFHIVTCYRGAQRGFGLEIEFIGHFTALLTATLNYSLLSLVVSR